MDDCRNIPRLEEINIPYYVQIYDIIYGMIQNGALQAGDVLPGENVLASYWNVSRSTVRMAVRKLEEDGLIYKMQGKKTTVTGMISDSHTGLNQIASPCLTGCIEAITRVEPRISFQNGGKLVRDLLGIQDQILNAMAVDVKYYVQEDHVASSVTILPLSELEREGVSADDVSAVKELVFHTLYQKARKSKLSVSTMEWTEEETDKPSNSILIVMDEVLTDGERSIGYAKYWMDSNWYRFTLERCQ